MKKTSYDEIIDRIGFYRNKSNLSLRETSMRLGYNPQFMKTIENKSIELKVRTLLDFCDIVDISIEDFFNVNQYSKQDLMLLEKFNKLEEKDKEMLLYIIDRLK